MELLKTDWVAVAQALLSGFIASWIFHGLTAHPKSTPFERVVQALIFTAIVQVPVIATEFSLKALGRSHGAVATWTKDAAFIWSMFFALFVGTLFAVSANKDFPHRFLRAWGWTKKHSFPSVWYHVFNDTSWAPFAVLHFKAKEDEVPRRLYGWVREWPDHPDSGHFVVNEAEWLLPDNTSVPLHGVDRILINSSDVEMIEFVRATEGGKCLSADPIETLSLQSAENVNAGPRAAPDGQPEVDHDAEPVKR